MRTKIEIETQFAPREEMAECKSFCLVGIGGAGMAPVARMLKRRGFEVHGSDSTESDETRRLVADGISVHIGHTGDVVKPGDALILTDAIDLDQSPEVAAARKLGCKLFRRSQALGWMLRDKKTVAVTGTHGKTTTSGLVGAALRAAGLDPTIVIGAYVPDFKGAVIEGQGEWAVIEACEAYDSLRDFDPYHVVLTNFESDHLDFHGDWEGLKTAMRAFVSRMPTEGRLVYFAEDEGAKEVAEGLNGKAVPYNSDSPLLEGLSLPGKHNRLNAEAARLIAGLVGAGNVDQALRTFHGAERRLQVLQEGPVTVVDDYAHMPKEIDASIQALRERFPDRKLLIVFQPHLYSRTADYLEEFGASLSAADRLVLTDIYPAREDPMPGISSSRIAEAVTCECHYVPSRHVLPRFVKALLGSDDDVVVGMGAGNISDFAPGFVNELSRGTANRVLVCFGGDSAEREVSIHSGIAIATALQSRGYQVTKMDVSENLLSGKSLADLAGSQRPDVAFLAVHGTHAEDGAIQGLFELLHIPYTGSGIQASALAMDKDRTKKILQASGLPVPAGVLVRKGGSADSVPNGRVIVKPNAQGSTVGLTFVERESDLPAALERAFNYCDEALVEEWVEGMEISVPVLVDRVLPAVEIVPASGRYDFAMKYLPGATEEICPARISSELTARVQEYALKAHRILGCQGATRTDMIIKSDGTPVILEVNTLPGMTPTSLLPKSAATAGIAFDDLCVTILEDALKKAPR
ncbi:MAG: D-alanine--D-alanine ligase [Chthonomonas sp.]|nr:D-alanine--D-alanine ligase [Chthonomonas sp.]